MLEFARWKYILVALVALFALVFAAPNFFGQDDALQVARKDRAVIDDAGRMAVEDVLKKHNVPFKRSYVDDRARDGAVQRRQHAAARPRCGQRRPGCDARVGADARFARAGILPQASGLRPMPLGLDLRGGLSLLYQVDVNGAVDQLLDSYEQDFRRALTAKQHQLHRRHAACSAMTRRRRGVHVTLRRRHRSGGCARRHGEGRQLT